jgi:hypothetical protein
MKKEIKKPNFFIIGAPKCGTTALSEYLRTHPDVFFSDPKEPNYFNTDFSDRQRQVCNENDYLNLFKEAKDGDKAIGEGTVWYLYSREAVSNILEFNPEAKFIIMMRNPIDMFVSLYYNRLWRSSEDAKNSIEDAWNLQESRKKNRNIPRRCRDPKLLQYGEICKLGEQVERVLRLLRREKILFIFFEDFKNNTKEVYRKTLSFLNLVEDSKEVFPVINKRRIIKYEFLRDIIYFIGGFKKRVGIKKSFGVLNIFYELNKKEVKRDVCLEQSFKNRLINYFEKDIIKLSKLTHKDLSDWLKI